MTFLCLDTFTRLSFDASVVPKKLLGALINFPCVRFSVRWIDSAIPVSMFQYPNRFCSTGIDFVVPESRLCSTGIDAVVPESTPQYRNRLRTTGTELEALPGTLSERGNDFSSVSLFPVSIPLARMCSTLGGIFRCRDSM